MSPDHCGNIHCMWLFSVMSSGIQGVNINMYYTPDMLVSIPVTLRFFTAV